MSDTDTTPPPSPETKRSSEQAARSIRVPRAPIRARPRQRSTSLSTRRRRPDFSFRRDESKHPNVTRRKSCCERWFGRRGSKKRKKKCKKKCKTRKRKRKSKTRKKKRKKRTKKNA